MIYQFTGVRIVHSSTHSHLRTFLNDIQTAFVKENIHETADSNMDQDDDEELPEMVLQGGDSDADDSESDVAIDDEGVDDNDEGWKTKCRDDHDTDVGSEDEDQT
jgi:hypothetical protein